MLSSRSRSRSLATTRDESRDKITGMEMIEVDTRYKDIVGRSFTDDEDLRWTVTRVSDSILVKCVYLYDTHIVKFSWKMFTGLNDKCISNILDWEILLSYIDPFVFMHIYLSCALFCSIS